MFNRKRIAELQAQLNALDGKVDRAYQRVTNLRTRVGEDAIDGLRHRQRFEAALTQFNNNLDATQAQP